MKIYRLEHEGSGLGMWMHSAYHNRDLCCCYAYECISARCNNNTHPNPHREFFERGDEAIEDEWLCATHSLSQFYAWFEFDWIDLPGFKLLEIEIDIVDCLVGKTQIMFYPGGIISKREVSEQEYREFLGK